jgi:hypothetical protein
LHVFVLEFHLPFLTLRDQSTTLGATNPLSDAQGSEDSLDVSYLQHQRPHDRRQQRPQRYVIREAHTSIVICGWDNSKWVGWAFVNAPFDPTTQGNDEDDEDDEDEGQDDEPVILEEDYFAVDGDGGIVHDANKPIWDPRRYWLRIIEIRILRIMKEWIWLVRFVEKGIEALVSTLR